MNLKLVSLLQCFGNCYKRNSPRTTGNDVDYSDNFDYKQPTKPPRFNTENDEFRTRNVYILQTGDGGSIDPPIWDNILAILFCCAIGALINYCIVKKELFNGVKTSIGEDNFEYLTKIIIPLVICMITSYQKLLKSKPRTSTLLITIFLQNFLMVKELQSTSSDKKILTSEEQPPLGGGSKEPLDNDDNYSEKLCEITKAFTSDNISQEEFSAQFIQAMQANQATQITTPQPIKKNFIPKELYELLDANILFSLLISLYFCCRKTCFWLALPALHAIVVRKTAVNLIEQLKK